MGLYVFENFQYPRINIIIIGNDDGALGRTGNENLPAVVEGFPPGTVVNQVVFIVKKGLSRH